MTGTAQAIQDAIYRGTENPLQQANNYPQLRFMGSKQRLLPWIHESLTDLHFDTVLDAFSGSGAVGYLFKTMGKRVLTNDSLNFAATVAKATIENSSAVIDQETVDFLLSYDPKHKHFIEKTFSGIFFTAADLRFLDRVCWNIGKLEAPYQQALTMAALIRSCVKRQPRGVFTVSGDLAKYNDGRRDLRLSLKDHFVEQVGVYNAAVFNNGRQNASIRGDVFNFPEQQIDLVYMDPPYVPRADDNCYIKRYHFLEGLSCYWKDLEIMQETKVKKIRKVYTPFSYRKTAINAFDQMFRKFQNSIIVLSYSSNGYPDLDILKGLMRRYKQTVEVLRQQHRYHFGTHKEAKRSHVVEYLIIGK